MVRAKSVQIIKSLKTHKHPHMPSIVLTLSLACNGSCRPILTIVSIYLVVQRLIRQPKSFYVYLSRLPLNLPIYSDKSKI
jgi:hypothetical protein